MTYSTVTNCPYLYLWAKQCEQTLELHTILLTSSTRNSSSMCSLREVSFETVFEKIRKFFKDDSLFDEAMSAWLRLAFDACEKKQIEMLTLQSEKNAKNLAEKFIPEEEILNFEEAELKKIKKAFLIVWIYIVSEMPGVKSLYFKQISKLEERYPSLVNADGDWSLLDFRNMVIACLQVLKGRLNKQTIFDVINCLTETKRILGGGQNTHISNCEMIYELEGNVTQEKRRPRPKRKSLVFDFTLFDIFSPAQVSPKNKSKLATEEIPPKTKKTKQQRVSSAATNVPPQNLEFAGAFSGETALAVRAACLDDSFEFDEDTLGSLTELDILNV